VISNPNIAPDIPPSDVIRDVRPALPGSADHE
jgi:hypothetical protein